MIDGDCGACRYSLICLGEHVRRSYCRTCGRLMLRLPTQVIDHRTRLPYLILADRCREHVSTPQEATMTCPRCRSTDHRRRGYTHVDNPALQPRKKE